MKTFGKKIIISDLECGETISKSGIIIPEEKFKGDNLRPRWGKVVAVGEEITDINEGEWILMEHGRWTHGIRSKQPDGTEIMVWHVDYSGVLAASEEPYKLYD